jgi:uncharacterized membrane protein HdeD (DUF308 family)
MVDIRERAREDLSQGATRLRQALVVRGVVAVLFGVLLLVWPGISLGLLVLAFGGYAIADGVLALYAAVTTVPSGRRWWPVLHGIAGIAAGVVVLVWPGVTALALLYLIGTWAVVIGAVAVVAAVTGPGSGTDRWLLGLNGAAGIVFGAIMWARPGAGALVLLSLVAAFAIVTGATLIAAGVRLRNRADALLGTPR